MTSQVTSDPLLGRRAFCGVVSQQGSPAFSLGAMAQQSVYRGAKTTSLSSDIGLIIEWANFVHMGVSLITQLPASFSPWESQARYGG